MAKSTSGTGWRQRSSGFLGGIAAVVLVVVLLGGMALGYEIEKGRVKKPAKPAAAAAKKAPAKAVPVRVVGTVSAKTATSITVTPTKGAARKITIAKGTVVVKAGSGAASDIAANARVVFSGTFTAAKAVIVLPTTARIGTKVTAADGTSMSLQNGKKVTKITTTGASVNKTSPATVADVVNGAKVLVGAVRTKAGAVIATEIVVLPGNSAFQ
ncbi:MAG TPA: hypothetical protein VIJ44_02560 [Acidimicrobiia bacterium]